MESVLASIRSKLPIADDDTHFDDEIIDHINSVFMDLHQIGVGPKNPAQITSELDTWEDALGNIDNLRAVKSYVSIRVKLIFDPPTNSSHLAALERQADRWESRLQIQTELQEKED